MLVTLETTACDLCGSDRQQVIMTGPDRLLGLPGRFQFVRCLDCGLVRQNPRLTTADLDFFYPSIYPSFSGPAGATGNRLQSLDRRHGQLKRVGVVRHYCRGGRLLDVGCATGHFLVEVSRSEKWQALGVEPNAFACEYARQVLGVDVVRGTLEEASFADAAFDVVTMWNVLEHVSSPMSNFVQANRVLRPHGFFILSVPVMTALLQKWFGVFWAEWDLPRHLYIFSRQAIQRFAEAAGFKVIAIQAPLSEYRVFQMSLAYWSRQRISATRLRSIVSSAVSFPVVRLMLILALRLVIPTRYQSVPVFVCQKQANNVLSD